MPDPDHAPGYVPSPDYTQQDWDDVSDNPEWTEADFAAARPAVDAFPALADTMRRVRGPQKAPTKEKVALRLDRRVLEHFRSTGPGWQARMNDVLLKATGLTRPPGGARPRHDGPAGRGGRSR